MKTKYAAMEEESSKVSNGSYIIQFLKFIIYK